MGLKANTGAEISLGVERQMKKNMEHEMETINSKPKTLNPKP